MPKYHVIVNYGGAISFDVDEDNEEDADMIARLIMFETDPATLVNNFNDVECETKEINNEQH